MGIPAPATRNEAIWGSGHRVARAEQRSFCVAPQRHTGSAQRIDVLLVDVAVVVGEVVSGVGRQLQRPDQEGGHLGSGDRVAGAIGIISAAEGDPALLHPHDVGIEPASHHDVYEQRLEGKLDLEFQEDIPLNMFVFSVNRNAALPSVFIEFTSVPEDPAALPTATINANRDRWIEEWIEVVTG